MLTFREREYVFNKLRNFISGNYVEEQLQKTKTRAEAIKEARRILSYSGIHGSDIPSIQCMGGKGIFAETPDGREQKYSWGEFVDYVLNKQVSIFEQA